MAHVVLLGDSIFDNAAYVPGEPDVVAQLNALLPPAWKATLRAVDGAVITEVERQLERLPPDATHLVLSAGGNDALLNVGILEAPARSAAEVLAQLADIADHFEADYRALLNRLKDRALPVVVCTIYNGSFDDPLMQRLATTALTVFNDVILRQAIQLRLPVIDLRAVCCTRGDYANPIEPSAAGGQKIARAIARVLQQHEFADSATIVYN